MITKRQFLKALRPAIFVAATMALIFSSSAVFAQVKIGTNPTTIEPNSNLEVEATNGSKVIIDKATGTLKVQNKPLAAATDSLVTRGPNGELHQMSISRLVDLQNVPVVVFSATLTSDYPIPKFQPHDLPAQRILLTPRPGYSAGWNSATKQFTLPSTGFYQVEAGLACGGTGTINGTAQYTRIWSSADDGGPIETGTISITTQVGDWHSLVWSGQWPGGETISLDGATIVAPGGNVNQQTTGLCVKGYLNITKIR